MITFFQPPTPPSNANLSPFCTKLDMILQLSGLEFERELQMDPREGPKQKVPFIKDGGEPLGDTQFIEAHLKTKYNVDLLAHLSPREQAMGRMIMGTVEEQLYFILVYTRWQIDANWPIMENIFFGHMPEGIRQEVSTGARKMIQSALIGQGIGRHSPDEAYTLGKRIINDLNALLGDTDYFLSDRPTSIDASVYGCLINLVQNPVQTPLADHIKGHNNLAAFLDRLSAEYFKNATRALAKAA
ncbi:glutathione S-transferase family protein [Maritalea porphyrae]|uniref:glutathione S-transferase family protein n=1 Tax=Maritalea porphyrae TaxID=880732 RepID=UPI0022B01853|nr:glutathione S-transferase family protein [Maritalea porphyrae]MCZ4272930.1 glutathione S-transferase family protein [Maritalea porphyrae]